MHFARFNVGWYIVRELQRTGTTRGHRNGDLPAKLTRKNCRAVISTTHCRSVSLWTAALTSARSLINAYTHRYGKKICAFVTWVLVNLSCNWELLERNVAVRPVLFSWTSAALRPCSFSLLILFHSKGKKCNLVHLKKKSIIYNRNVERRVTIFFSIQTL